MKKLAILVAALAISVGVLVGCGGGSGSSNGPAVTLALATDDTLKFNPNALSANKGDNLTVNITGSAMLHDFNIDALNIHQTIDMGKTVAVKIPTDKPGAYTFYCNQPGHKDSMNGTLTIK